MPNYEFEVSNCIKIEVFAEDAESARMKLVDDHEMFDEQLTSGCCISEGTEVD